MIILKGNIIFHVKEPDPQENFRKDGYSVSFDFEEQLTGNWRDLIENTFLEFP